MFDKKKQITPATEGAKTVTPGKEAEAKTTAEKPKGEKLPKPRPVPGPVEKRLVTEYKMDAGIVLLLKAVVRRRPQAEEAFDYRVYDEADAEANGVKIQSYTSLDGHPELILYDGWFDERTKHVEMTERKKLNCDTHLFTEAEIQQKIEALSKPGETVFFFQSRGPAVGGPLGRGAAIVELSPADAAKKQKKYTLYTANVINMEPAASRQKFFGSDKAKDVAKWLKGAHEKRMY